MAVNVDPTCRYTESHEWVRLVGDNAHCGITDYAQQQLSDIVYVELPEVGEVHGKGDVFAVVESVKAASDCYLPLSGKIVEINEDLDETPELVNTDPYGAAWIVKIAVDDPDDISDLLSPEAYRVLVDKALAEEEH